MVRKFEKEYRLRENDDVLLRLKDVLRDIDLRVDAIELLGDAFTKGNRLDVDALVKSINDDFAQKSAQLADLLGELENGLTPDRIIETDEKRFTSDTEIAGLQNATAAVATALANGLAQKLNSATFTAHRDDKNNPHAVTKAQLGLQNVEDLAPAEMPVSEAQAEAIASRLAKSANLSDLDDAATALDNLGVSAFLQTLLDDADASTALTTLGVSAFVQTLLNDANAAAARATIGAQANLGYTPVNKAGDTMTGSLAILGGLRAEVPSVVIRNPGANSNQNGTYNSAALRAQIAHGGEDDPSGAMAQLEMIELVGSFHAARISLNGFEAGWQTWDFKNNGSFNCGGAIYGSTKNFLIDHPLDPLNRDLVFSSTESPHYGVEAWGVARLEGGRATVDIDAASNLTAGTWAALAQRTVVTSLQNQEGFARLRPGPIEGGCFEIIAEDETSSDLVAWHVAADRADPVVKTLENADPETGLLIPEADKEELA